MKLENPKYGTASLAVVYDLMDLREEVKLDSFRASKEWQVVVGVGSESIILDGSKTNQRAVIGAVRFEYLDESSAPFEERKLTGLDAVLSALPSLSTKSIAITLNLQGDVEEGRSAAEAVAGAFLKDAADIRGRLGGDLLSAAVWLHYGSTSEHKDLQLMPCASGERGLGVRMALLKDVAIRDRERLKVELADMYPATIRLLNDTLTNL